MDTGINGTNRKTNIIKSNIQSLNGRLEIAITRGDEHDARLYRFQLKQAWTGLSRLEPAEFPET
ncbi:MAG: hypothetical protein BWY51_00043 [Parcubacteria group bacterium ADurb.Bin316]|nr:MAG: hypothetical protein BWY51_00043 [Parcubacteria group bacterium ADurb.Bin316]HOZ56007.1 hypothetical protein [bacterium]